LFIHGARDRDHHPLSEEVRALVADHAHVRAHAVYSRPLAADVPGVDYDTTGRIDSALITRLMPDPGAEFYLCGPAGFMADIRSGLIARAVPQSRIHTEIFGPVG
jgi:ferredoxin-NADP reductase